VKKYISTFILCFSIWVALAGFGTYELILGGVVSIIIALIAKNIFTYELKLNFPIKLLAFIFVYIPIFLIELIKANIDVAFRVLSPKMPINPGFVKIPTKINSNLGKLTLVNSITLTPGTISLDVEENSIYVHCINLKGDNDDDYQKDISSKFEKVLRRIFK